MRGIWKAILFSFLLFEARSWYMSDWIPKKKEDIPVDHNHSNIRPGSLRVIHVCDRHPQNKTKKKRKEKKRKKRKSHARRLRRAKRRKITLAANRRDSLKAQLARLDIRCSVSECQEFFLDLWRSKVETCCSKYKLLDNYLLLLVKLERWSRSMFAWTIA